MTDERRTHRLSSNNRLGQRPSIVLRTVHTNKGIEQQLVDAIERAAIDREKHWKSLVMERESTHI